MFTNADITLYLYSKEGKMETYTRLPVEDVFWDEVEGATLLKTGQKNTASVLLMIPMESLDEPITFTRGKDLVVKGLIPDKIDSTDQKALSESLAGLKARHQYRTVMTADAKLYGSESMQHYELACK